MSENILHEKIGRFIVRFQDLENALTEIIALLAKSEDEEVIYILASQLEYSNRVKTTDVLFARFIDFRSGIEQNEKKEFHELMNVCLKLGELRNELAHSKYMNLIENGTVMALVRENSRLSSSQGVRLISQEDLSIDSFDPYFARISEARTNLEKFRLKIIDWE
jgi:hypothetical protein